MIHKIIGYGSNGSRGVMDYMLKEEDKKTPRAGATVLRGDVEAQAKLIDSLVGQFKQQYVTGVFSFEESPDEITEEQKQELMDSAEEAIRAGLDADRVSISWIEHTDKVHDDVNNPRFGKNRLELNYIVACVDLKHGRMFQPYLHHVDQDRFNALKDIQNIKHGYTDPNDPLKARNMAQSNNLPEKVAELKEVITEHIEGLVTEGLVNNRDDVKRVLNDLGFELSRETNNSISVKRPDGGRNLKFTTAKDGGLYDINFRPNSTSEAEIRRASESYRASATERLAESQAVYERELERKREYHEKRHSRPQRQQRTVARPANPAFSRYTPYRGRYAITVPNPFTQTLRRRAKRDNEDDRELYKSYSDRDREQGRQDNPSNNLRPEQVVNGNGFSSFDNIRFRGVRGGVDSEISNRPATADIQARPENGQGLSNTARGLTDEQTVTRQDRPSPTSSTRHNTSTRAYAGRERQGYSSLEELARTANNNADRATGTLADTVQELEEHHTRAERSLQWLDNSTQNIIRANEQLSERHNQTKQHSNSAHRASERVSEYDSTRKQSIERYRAVRERTRRASDFTEQNNQQSTVAKETARTLAEIASNIELVRHKQEEQEQQVRASRSYNPRMR